eukprot:TRINITY_DN1262_c0_g1_i1.p1 TRINITY_DN1262_c0_g1~~TRINITY_DN1262_c0_g1_i1.p1  ORF type:complete len:575 (+),score=66.63 TRINITY_DN1262_c0_g1_i1:60-1784(+)
MSSMDYSLFGECFDIIPEIDKDFRDIEIKSGVDPSPKIDGDFKDILGMSMEDSGINSLADIFVGDKSIAQSSLPNWCDDTDEFLRSMLTGSEISTDADLGLNSDTTGLSDTSSDSGVIEDPCQRALLSPGLDDGPIDSTPLTTKPISVDFAADACLLADKNNAVGYLCSGPNTGNDMKPADPMLIEESGNMIEPLTLDVVTCGPVIQTQQKAVTTTITNKSIAPAPSSSAITFASGRVDPIVNTSTGTTTIILPAIGAQTAAPIGMTYTSHRLAPREPGHSLAKKRRPSASSTDSGVDDSKYPRLEMSEEELKMANKEGMVFPKYYPLTREEERNLKKIRRKIRNKLSAQDSRKRKREYLDSMEDRVKICNDENEQLKEKIQVLETQNRTLAAQLRRLHQMVASGGARHGQTSTALMVLLLSTALFLIPGLNSDQETKSEIDIQAAVKMPPLPGQSRSLLQFSQEPANIADFNDFAEEKVDAVAGMELDTTTPGNSEGKGNVSPPQVDHDYATLYSLPPIMKMEPGKAWIDEDAPPMGYGRALKSEEERQMNVNVSSSGQGTRTVVLQIPKGIQ